MILGDGYNLDINYVAGFYDGEGCIFINDGYMLVSSIVSTDFSILNRLTEVFGGTLYKKIRYKEIHKQKWEWFLSGKDLISFLTKIEPYVINKKEQIKLGLEYNRIKRGIRGKDLCLSEIQIREKFKNDICKLKHIEISENELNEFEKIDISKYNISNSYIAGFFDAEGYVGIDKNNYILRVGISNTDYLILYMLNKFFGGGLRYLKKKKDIHRNIWQWYIVGNPALEFLKIIEKYLILKKEQVKLAIIYKEEFKRGCGENKPSETEIEKRKWFINELKRLKCEYVSEEIIEKYKEQIEKLKIDKDIRSGKQPTLHKWMVI